MTEYIERKAALRPFIIDKNGNRIHETDIDNFSIEISIKQVKQILREIPRRCGRSGAWRVGRNRWRL